MTNKQFETKKDFSEYINRLRKRVAAENGMSEFDWLMYGELTEKDIAENLIKDGYTNLDNLVANGERYMIDGHTNNGWLWEDEADLEYIKAHGITIELRKRH